MWSSTSSYIAITKVPFYFPCKNVPSTKRTGGQESKTIIGGAIPKYPLKAIPSMTPLRIKVNISAWVTID